MDGKHTVAARAGKNPCASLQKHCQLINSVLPTAGFEEDCMTCRTRTNPFALGGCGMETVPTNSAESRTITGGKRICQDRPAVGTKTHSSFR